MLCQVSSGFDPVDKPARADAQPRRHPQHRRKRRHPIPTLQVRHERRMHLGRLRQAFLRHAPLQPQLSHPSTERLSNCTVSGSVSGHDGRSQPTPPAKPIAY